MNYFDKQKVENKIKSDIEEIKDFDEVEHFIDANLNIHVVSNSTVYLVVI